MSGARVLVVDDEESILFGMKGCLEPLGYAVDCARASEQAQALLRECRYAVVIADLRLRAAAQNEGLELLAHVRALSPGTATILLTAFGSHETAELARHIGVDALLNKSQDIATIVSVVERLAALAPPA